MTKMSIRTLTLVVAVAVAVAAAAPLEAQMQESTDTKLDTVPVTQVAAPIATAPAGVIVLPADTMFSITPTAEITSKKMKEGDTAAFQAVGDVVQSGVLVIPRGAPVMG